MMDIAFVLPNCPGPYRDKNIMAEHLGIALLSSVSKQHGFSASIVDARMNDLSQEDVINAVEGHRTVGLSIISGDAVIWAAAFARRCRDRYPETHIVAGGYYATLLPELLLEQIPELEIVMVGEGEETVVELLTAFRNASGVDDISGIVYRRDVTTVRTGARKLIQDLDTNPFPERYAAVVADKGFEVLVEGSRGCYNNCTFCAVKPFFGGHSQHPWRGRSAESLIEEIKHIRTVYPKARKIRFVDPDFIGNRDEGSKRASQFCDLILENGMTDYRFYIETRVANITEDMIPLLVKMKKAGFVEIYLGLESGSDAILKTMNKRTTVADSLRAIRILNEIGIDFVYGFMMLTPWTTEEDMQKNADFLDRIGDVQFDRLFYRLNLIPGTPSVKYAEHKGLVLDMNSEGYFDYRFEFPAAAAVADIWDYLQQAHPDFLMEIWYVYKDIKSWHQNVPTAAKPYLREISSLSIKLFNNLRACVDDSGTEAVVSFGQIDSIITEATELVREIEHKTDPQYRYPRKNRTPMRKGVESNGL